jgi:hypothetical protein
MEAAVAHVVSQIESNVLFLLDHHYISQQDASLITSKLPAARPPTTLPIVQARALWAYNEKDQVSPVSPKKIPSNSLSRTQMISRFLQTTSSKSSKKQIRIGGLEKFMENRLCFLPLMLRNSLFPLPYTMNPIMPHSRLPS